MKKILVALLATALIVTSVTAFATESPSAKNYWQPVASGLGDPIVENNYSYEYILSICMKSATNKISVSGFAACCGFNPRITDGTVYEKDYCLTRNNRDFHIVISGNVVWVVFITDQECLCVAEIITDPREFNAELVSKLMYYISVNDPVDARKFDTELTYSYRLYSDEIIPIYNDVINLNRMDPTHLVDVDIIN
ncbi:hypothetical protein IKG31_02665 [Candidatus Saccharibacteria bacterium]|nr:hypothetical protein [Candidatus Saccharibacteria bacterium]